METSSETERTASTKLHVPLSMSGPEDVRVPSYSVVQIQSPSSSSVEYYYRKLTDRARLQVALLSSPNVVDEADTLEDNDDFYSARQRRTASWLLNIQQTNSRHESKETKYKRRHNRPALREDSSTSSSTEPLSSSPSYVSSSEDDTSANARTIQRKDKRGQASRSTTTVNEADIRDQLCLNQEKKKLSFLGMLMASKNNSARLRQAKCSVSSDHAKDVYTSYQSNRLPARGKRQRRNSKSGEMKQKTSRHRKSVVKHRQSSQGEMIPTAVQDASSSVITRKNTLTGERENTTEERGTSNVKVKPSSLRQQKTSTGEAKKSVRRKKSDRPRAHSTEETKSSSRRQTETRLTPDDAGTIHGEAPVSEPQMEPDAGVGLPITASASRLGTEEQKEAAKSSSSAIRSGSKASSATETHTIRKVVSGTGGFGLPRAKSGSRMSRLNLTEEERRVRRVRRRRHRKAILPYIALKKPKGNGQGTGHSTCLVHHHQTPSQILWTKKKRCTASHILDFKDPSYRINCFCGRETSQFMVNVFDVKSLYSEDVCPNCCRKHFSKDAAALLVSLNYLSHIGLRGRCISQTKKEIVFDVKMTSRVGIIIDTFRWLFHHMPFRIEGDVVRTVCTPLYGSVTKRNIAESTRLYEVTFVAASWGMNHGRGVTLYAKSVTNAKD